MKDASTIHLTDKEVNLSDYKIGDTCDIQIKVKVKGMNERQEYSSGPIEATSKPPEPSKPPKKYIEYQLEVQEATEDEDNGSDYTQRHNIKAKKGAK